MFRHTKSEIIEIITPIRIQLEFWHQTCAKTKGFGLMRVFHKSFLLKYSFDMSHISGRSLPPDIHQHSELQKQDTEP